MFSHNKGEKNGKQKKFMDNVGKGTDIQIDHIEL
jgi:hypothetical protein